MSQSIYEKYGGFGSVSKVVMAFYDKMLDSDELGPYFDEVDMPKLIDHQTKFVAYLLGGPADFSEERLTAAHTRLSIGDSDFDEMKEILDETLEEHGFEAGDRAAVAGEFEKRRHMIVAVK